MASTNKTANYNLSQYINNDKPTYLGDYNSDMLKIDTQMKANNDLSQTAKSQSDTAITNASAADAKADTAITNASAADAKADTAEATATQAQSDATEALANSLANKNNIETLNNELDKLNTIRLNEELLISQCINDSIYTYIGIMLPIYNPYNHTVNAKITTFKILDEYNNWVSLGNVDVYYNQSVCCIRCNALNNANVKIGSSYVCKLKGSIQIVQ